MRARLLRKKVRFMTLTAENDLVIEKNLDQVFRVIANFGEIYLPFLIMISLQTFTSV